jgi:hypothetical protein
MTPVQRKIIRHLEDGGRLDADYEGYRVHVKGYRPGRLIQDKTMDVVLNHLRDRLNYVYVRSPRFDVPGQFVCLAGNEEQCAEGSRIISIQQFNSRKL